VQNDYPPRIVDGKKVVRQVHTHLTSSLHTYFMQINVTTCEFYAMHSCLTVVRMQARNTALIINPHPQGALELRWMAPVFLIKLSTSLRTRIHLISIHVCIDVQICFLCVCVIVRLNVREGSQGVKPHHSSLQRRPIRQPYHCLHLFHQTSKAQT